MAAAGYGGGGTMQQRRGVAGRYQSLFYRDLNLAAAGTRASGAQSSSSGAAGSSSWRDNVGGGADPPPPPCFTLEDRIDRTPSETLLPPPAAGEYRSPDGLASRFSDSKSPLKTPQSGASRRSGGLFGDFQSPGFAPPSSSPPSAWWSSSAAMRDWSGHSDGERENLHTGTTGIHHHHLHHQAEPQSGLLTLPAPRQIIRPNIQRSAALPDAGEEGDEWVTIYGFPGEDTNLVLREFEKCGPIIKQVAGPATSNWLHIQYQSRQDAQKALAKNGMQLYGALIIGVKPVDPLQRQALMDKAQRSSGLSVPHPKASAKGMASAQTAARPYYLHSDSSLARPASTIASPTKSLLSKVVDLVFGF
ncbi:nuclear pore complex protein NUP35-like [Selaginella moellendorffii]|uniref:nuclear pore complex protein NUP35-like n=1 Tax=Selaginella moellendorffii TaxID=88036 RepID=UPI000D1CED59|nr:nuclear pore complex protein NUP35-like [Selaginella moellendorffii]|eukprot:XP_024529811.1 nuclear pore complex protein NUP35-like [Selaginella moellendorffii]